MKKTFNIVLMIIFMFLSEQSFALRCGNKLVDVGDSKPKVNSVCGNPDYKEQRDISYPSYCSNRVYVESEGLYYSKRNKQYHQHYLNNAICRYERVDVWVYNFGPRKFMRELIFRGGVVENIITLEYGY